MLVLKRSGSLEQRILSIKNQLVLLKMILVRKNYQTLDHLPWVAFYLVFGLSSPISQFLNGMHEFGVVAGKNCPRAPWTYPFKLARTSSFRPGRTT